MSQNPQYYQQPNPLAVWALVLGIIALVLSPLIIGGVISLVALLVGVLAARRQSGKGLAITGIILAALAIPVASLVGLFTYKIYNAASSYKAITGPAGQTQGQIVACKVALDNFKTDNGRYPTALEGLDILKQPAPGGRPYLDVIPNDPWGRHYIYVPPTAGDPDTCDVFSAGPDGKPGTSDDVNEHFGRP
ncbi:MAG TPA: type II secretion system protein GspG [Phycisphaerae bacterium]|nr:type II secretion system protein GspG [Phycisphaerae bacterium]